MIRPDAYELLEKRMSAGYKKNDVQNKQTTKKLERFRTLLHRLLVGERLTAEEGRELFWEVLSECKSLEADPFTGNSQTYYNLGMQVLPRYLCNLAKDIDIQVFHKMELEAQTRRKKESQ